MTPRHDFRWRVAPGLTGLAQMLGPPSATGSLSLDRYYVSRGTLLLDMRLVAYSFVVNVLGKARARRLLIGSGLLSRRLSRQRIDRTIVRSQRTPAI